MTNQTVANPWYKSESIQQSASANEQLLLVNTFKKEILRCNDWMHSDAYRATGYLQFNRLLCKA